MPRHHRAHASRIVLGLLALFLANSSASGQTLSVDTVTAEPGSSFSVDLLGEWATSVQGVQAIVEIDDPSSVLSTLELETAGTLTDSLGAEFVVAEIDPLTNVAVLSVLLQFIPPIDNVTYPPAIIPLSVARFVGTTTPGAAIGANVSFDFLPTYTPDVEPIQNLIVVANDDIEVTNLISGSLGIVAPPPTFTRGDANGDGSVGLPDVIFLLFYLFSGGAVPPCADAADANDDGNVGFVDATRLLSLLFQGGLPLLAPYPGPGMDPTMDTLPTCNP